MKTLAFTSTLLTWLLLSDAGFCKQPAPLLEIRFNENANSEELSPDRGPRWDALKTPPSSRRTFGAPDSAGGVVL